MLANRIAARIAAALLVAVTPSATGCRAPEITDPQVTSPPPATPLIVTIEPSALNLAAGESRQLRGSVRTPQGIFLPTALVWSSGDESVASVSGTGMVTAKREGQTSILAKVSVGQGLGRATVKVAPAQ